MLAGASSPLVSVVAAFVVLGATAYVAIASATAPPAPRGPAVSAAERAELAQIVAGEERAWEERTTRHFPSDRWSQRDDFHGLELKKIVELRRQKHARFEDILRGIDDDIHRRKATRADEADLRDARAVPCKPRPIYD